MSAGPTAPHWLHPRPERRARTNARTARRITGSNITNRGAWDATLSSSSSGGTVGEVAAPQRGVIVEAKDRLMQVGMVAWAVIGAAVAWSSINSVNDDALGLVAAASIVGPLLAASAATAWGRVPSWATGILLAGSAIVTPTYFAWPFNAAALLAGVGLVVLRPHVGRASGPTTLTPG